MKACNNCRAVYSDEYGGQCNDCGAPMGSVQGSNQGDLAFRYAQQLAEGQREANAEQSFKAARARGGIARPGDAYDSVKMKDEVVEAARRVIVVPDAAT